MSVIERHLYGLPRLTASLGRNASSETANSLVARFIFPNGIFGRCRHFQSWCLCLQVFASQKYTLCEPYLEMWSIVREHVLQ